SLVPVALLIRRVGLGIAAATRDDLEAIRASCVFTTHTPVPAGHDRFYVKTAAGILGAEMIAGLAALGCLENDTLNMTLLGMFFAGFINGVAKRHGEVS